MRRLLALVALPKDAVAVRLDHRDGFSAIVVARTSWNPGGDLEIAAPYAVKGEGRIFPR